MSKLVAKIGILKLEYENTLGSNHISKFCDYINTNKLWILKYC